MNRRLFLTQSGLAAAGLGLAQGAQSDSQSPIIVFEKAVQNLSYDVIGEHLAKMGLQGVEATIRKGGHIEPKDAESEVPKMVASLAKNGQKALIAATSVLEVNAENEKFLRILKANGITRYRMNYYRYDLKRSPLAQMREHAAKLKDLAAMNQEIGVQSLYQIHSGSKLAGSLSWDAAIMFEGINPDHAAVAFDLRHVRMDTGISFDLALANLRPHIRSIYVKDARWVGERTNKWKSVPLDTGFVDEATFNKVRKGLGPMPLSLHMEWGKTQLYPKGEAMEAMALIARDAKTLRSWL
ncbi:TIM barrel protein [Verrucomicrobiaceae bacterium 227]